MFRGSGTRARGVDLENDVMLCVRVGSTPPHPIHRLSLPYHDHASNTRYMVTVNNLAESGAPHMACLASADTAASVAIRNAVPCISSTYGAVCVLFDDVCTAVGIVNTPRLSHNSPSYEDLVAAFDEKHQCGVVITIPIGSKPSHTLTPSGVRTQSGPAVAALSVGYAAGEPVSESDLLTASYIAAYISPYVIVLLESFLPELMRDCACDADTCATRRVRGGDGNEPPSASALRAHAGADAMAALPALDCLEPLLMLDNVRGDGAPRANQAHGSAHRMVLHPVWTAAWFNMRRHGRPATSQLASTMLQSLTFDEKVDDDHTAAEHPQVARTSSSAPVAQRDDLAG